MNSLTSQQRKITYGIAIVFLLVPIYLLGAPTAHDVQPGIKADVGGGKLAQMRVEYQLGESSLGEIDPSSSAMNLLLLGLRGPAATVLNIQALEYQEKKDWAKLKTTVDAILKLQPHSVEIWKFQGWNLAFNVSREWDKVVDRFYWVKEGLKFLEKGTLRNQTAAILFHNVGDFTGRKIGNSDEKSFFRKFFMDDPDDRQFGEGKSDPAINPDSKDNYLVAYDWFVLANEKETHYGIKGKERMIARQGPGRALFDYARARQTDGVFGEENRADWKNAQREWTEVFGKEIFLGLHEIKFMMNSTPEDLAQMAEEGETPLSDQIKTWQQNVNTANYKFWADIAICESDPLMVDAHQKIYQGKLDYHSGRIYDDLDENDKPIPSSAEKNFMEGMKLMADVLKKYGPDSGHDLSSHDLYLEEGFLALYYWTKIHQVNGREPGPTPMGILTELNPELVLDLEKQFRIESIRGVKDSF